MRQVHLQHLETDTNGAIQGRRLYEYNYARNSTSNCIVALITCRESKKHPTYCRIQTNNVYVVYKYIQYRTGGDYETLKFKREKNKWVYVKTKHILIVIIGQISDENA